MLFQASKLLPHMSGVTMGAQNYKCNLKPQTRKAAKIKNDKKKKCQPACLLSTTKQTSFTSILLKLCGRKMLKRSGRTGDGRRKLIAQYLL